MEGSNDHADSRSCGADGSPGWAKTHGSLVSKKDNTSVLFRDSGQCFARGNGDLKRRDCIF
jgi:hypothetical protein